MTDIVERLQERKKNGDGWTRPVAADALAEIERLRAEIVLLEATGAEASDEIERLRAALLAVETACADHSSRASIAMIARAALKGSKR